MSDRGIPVTPDLIPLVPVRKVRVSEPEAGTVWQDGLIKELTGGEPIGVRALPATFLDAAPDFRLRILGRDTPDSEDL